MNTKTTDQTMTNPANYIEYDQKGDARCFVGPDATAVLAMAALASGLRLYAKTKMLPNRMWTAKAMMKTAEHHLGRKFKARDYLGAADALYEKVQAEKAQLPAVVREG